MSKLAITLVLVASTHSAYADVVEPTQEGDPAADESPKVTSVDPRILGPSMVAPESAANDDEPGTPPLSGGHLAGEVLLGGLFGVGGTIGGAYAGYSLEMSGGCHGEFCGIGGIVLGGAAGLTFVTPLGVYLAGNSGGETGSLGATIGGSVLGSLAGIAIAAGMSESEPAVGVTFLIAGPLVGSMIGFNLTRKYDGSHKPARHWAPIANVSSGNSTFGFAGAF